MMRERLKNNKAPLKEKDAAAKPYALPHSAPALFLGGPGKHLAGFVFQLPRFFP
jgi:hypothetical protein